MRRRPPPILVDTQRPRWGLKLLIALFVVFVSLTAAVRLYIDQLWFESLGFQSVYWYGITAQAAAFGLVFVLTAAVLWAIFRLIIAAGGEMRRSFLVIQGRPIPAPPPEVLKRIALAIAIIVGL